LSGRVRANEPSCSADTHVRIRQLIFGTSRYLTVAKLRTNLEGRFNVRERVRWSSLYSAVARREGGCRKEISDPVDVYARVSFSIKVSDDTPERFTNVRIKGRVRPSHPHTKALLQRKRGDRWVTIQRQEINDQSRFSFLPFADWEGERVFRVKWPKRDRDHETGVSRKIIIRTT
jgi:hypothetical protein